MEIRIDDLTGQEIFDLLNEHLQDMHAASPPESVHALDLSRLKSADITFWTVWSEGNLAGCGAIKELNSSEGEIKSMRTAKKYRRKGVAAKLLNHILAVAQERKYKKLYLETGSVEYFNAALNLYKSIGFRECGPFAQYEPDPYSVFMEKDIT